MHFSVCARIALAISGSLCAAARAAADITLDDIARGSYIQTGAPNAGGGGTPGGNYLTGNYSPDTYRSFFTFDLASLTGTVTGAQFQVSTFDSGLGPGPLTLDLYAYSGNVASLDAGTAGTAGYNALASGTLMGTASIPTSGAPPTVTITLDGAAIALLQADEGGFFAVGGSLASATAGNDALFSGSFEDPLTELTVTTSVAATPEPSSLLLLASGCLGMAFAVRRRYAR